MAIRKGIWLPSTSYLPEDDRLGLSAFLYPSGSTTSQLSVRAGCIPRPNVSAAGPFQVVTSTGMNTQVMPGQYVYPGAAVNQGAYIVTNDATTTRSHAAADPANARIDVVYLLVTDTNFGDGTNNSDVLIQAGTPALVPTVPSIPTGAQALAQVTVRAGATSILSTDISDKRVFTTTLGGRLLVSSAGALPANPYDGQEVIRTDLLAGFVYLSGAWRQTFGAGSPAETVIYVSSRGSDASDGLSASNAKLTLVGALAALSGAGKIIIGAGTIDAGGTIDLTDRSGVVIEGLSGNSPGTVISTVQYTSSGTSPVFKLLRSSGCALRNFKLLYTSPSYTGDLIDASGDVSGDSPLNHFEGLTIVSSGSAVRTARSGIRLDNCDSKSISRCTIHDCVVGIYARSVSTQHANAIVVEGCHFSNNVTAHIRNAGQGWSIRGTVFEPLVSGAAGALLTDSGYTTDGIAVSGCWLGDLTTGAGGTQFIVGGHGISFTGNFIGISGSSGATGISLLASSAGVAIKGNKFHGSTAGETGIVCDSTCSDLDFGGNSFTNVTNEYGTNVQATVQYDMHSNKPAFLVNNTSTTDGRATVKFQAARTAVQAFEMGIDVLGGNHKWWEIYDRTNGASRLKIPAGGGVVVGETTLANAATDGYLYLPRMFGTPTGTPTAQTNTIPMVYDYSANKIWAYNGGVWKSVALT